MTITKYSYDRGNTYTTTHFGGRVIEVKKWTEMRNWSDTLDYTDMRSTECTAALVWLGTRFLPPTMRGFPSMSYTDGDLPDYMQSQVRDLEFFEQFAWVDCTNIFADRCGYSLEATVDAHPTDGVEPLMWANYHAWKGYEAALEEKRRLAAAAEAAARAAEREKLEAKRAKRAANDAAKEAAARKLLDGLVKGTMVATTTGATGKLTWMGTKKFRGLWQARVGVKDSRGEMHWLNATDIVR